jgi:hypothetical protein
MVFKLLEAAESRWRAVNGPHLVALVRAGARFEKGRLVERPKEAPEEESNKVAACSCEDGDPQDLTIPRNCDRRDARMHDRAGLGAELPSGAVLAKAHEECQIAERRNLSEGSMVLLATTTGGDGASPRSCRHGQQR